MPRTATRGLDYTFLDKDFFTDRKVRRLRRRCGNDSPYVFLALLCLIAPEGYYIKYDQDTIDDLADMTGFDEKRVQTILESCAEVGLLDNNLMEAELVLTSHGIQKYYADTCAHLKRKAKVEEYSLLDDAEKTILSERKSISSEEIAQKVEFIPTKEKKRKEKNIKENSSYCSAEEEKEEILSFCFFKDWARPNEEVKKIIAFNNTGGRNWDSMSRIEKESALTLWKQQPEQKPRLGKDFIAFWYEIYSGLRSLNAPYDIRMDALSDDIGWHETAGRLCLHCSDDLRIFIERNLDLFKPPIREFQKRRHLSNDLLYSIIPPNNHF